MTVVSGCQDHTTDRAMRARKPRSRALAPSPIRAGVHVRSRSGNSDAAAEIERFDTSAGPFAADDGSWSAERDPEVSPEGSRPGIPQIEAHHLVEGRPAPAGHLPEAGDAWLGFQNPAAMPRRVMPELVRKGRARAHERHLPDQHVPELGQLVHA